MSSFSGVVGYVSEKNFGGKLLHSFTLKGTEGFFRTGENKPKFKVGSYVTFEADDKKNVDFSSIKGAVRAPESADKSITPASTKQASEKFIDYRAEADKARQKSIHYQSAHKDAIEVAKFLVDKEMVPVPSSKSKQYDTFLKLIDELTNKFFGYFEKGGNIEGNSAVEEITDKVEIKESNNDDE